MSEAKLYVVNSSRGITFAVQQLNSGLIWTERSERAARDGARERKLSIIDEVEISHDDFLRLMGHEPAPAKPQAAPASASEVSQPPTPLPAGSVSIQKFNTAPAAPAVFDSRYHWEDEPESAADALVMPHAASPPGNSVFYSERPVIDTIDASIAFPAIPLEHPKADLDR